MTMGNDDGSDDCEEEHYCYEYENDENEDNDKMIHVLY